MFSGKDAIASKAQKKRKANRLKNIFIFLFIFSGIASGLYSAPRYKEITISNINISGNEVIEKSDIESKVWQKLSGNEFFFFPNKNIFLYPREKIVESIKDMSPYILTANVSFRDFNSINVEVEERKPYAMYCGGEYKKETNIDCYFLDERGFIFDKAPQFSGNPFIRYFGTTSEPYIGRNYSDVILFQSLSRFIENLKQISLNVVSVNYISPEEIYFYLENDSKFIISEKTDFNKILSYLKEIMASPDFKGKDENGKLMINYIDFRFGNKIFYKK